MENKVENAASKNDSSSESPKKDLLILIESPLIY